MDIKEGFFIKRPVLSTVISIVITLLGIVSIKVLPIEQYPNLTPPQVQVQATYNGASAEVLAQSVASVLESQINGVDNMIYMNSVSSGSGRMTINVTFAIGTDPDQATINVNNRVQLAMASMPEQVQRMGVSVIKSSPSILMLVFLTSPNGRYDTTYLSNYALLNIVDDLKLIDGVGNAQNFSSKNYSIRVWLNPKKMAKYNITTDDVAKVIRSQNSQYAAGKIGAEPMDSNVGVTWQIITQGRLSSAKEFENIIVKNGDNGSILKLKDIARIELGAENYNFTGKQNGKDSVPIGIYLAPDANALATANEVKKVMDNLSQDFPDGITYTIPYDTTTFIKISIEEVVKTLIESIILVFFVVYIFLQNIRATIIPTLAVPVSVIGTFAGMYLLGFTINTLTMFGLVLAIGMVVDDAIVVLENVERHIKEGLTPKEATSKAMTEVTRPIIAIVLVLCSVFIPVAFTGGMAGKMYQQFAITIVISVVISGVVALTFTPAMCSLILKPKKDKIIKPFIIFNNFFDKVTNGYMTCVSFFIKKPVITISIFICVIVSSFFILKNIPSSLVPDEDQGYLLGLIVLPDGASLSRTLNSVNYMDNITMKNKAVENVISFTGMDILSSSLKSNYASVFITLKSWDDRKNKDESSFSIVNQYMGYGAKLKEGVVMAFNPPSIMGMSTTGGFEMYVQNRVGDDNNKMYNVIQEFQRILATKKEISNISTTFSISSPQLYVVLDEKKATDMGVNIGDVFSTMESTFGASYINDFNLYGRTFRVYVQSDKEFRAVPQDIGDVFVKNKDNNQVALNSLLTVKVIGGAETLERFNNFPAAKFLGNPAPNYSTGQAMDIIEKTAKEVLPNGYTIAWSGTSYQEKRISGSSVLIFTLALLMVFLILSAQYESWSLPISVISAVPFAILGASVASYLRGFDNDIYFQVALVTLIGLSAKNAILIVEFSVDKYRAGGISIIDAAYSGAKLRFRPIIMTSLAFIFGCVPLAISSGAGAASRHAIGTSVIGGMIIATVFAPMFIPFFFKLIMTIVKKVFKR